MRKRINRLRSKPAIIGWGSFAVFIWKILENLDTLKGVVENMNAVWNFLSTPIGMLVLLLVGFVILGYLVLRPEKKAEKANASIDSNQDMIEPLTTEQVATRLAFVRRAKAVAEQFSQSIQDSCSVSLIRFFTDISKENRVSERRKDDQLIDQSMRLVKYDLDNLSGRVSAHKSDVSTFNTTVSEKQIHSTCNEAVKMFHEVTRLMKEIFVILNDLGMKGNIPVWEKAWQKRIKSDLGANYDELIRLLKDMRSETPQQFQDLIPTNSTLVSFANTFQIPWERN